MKGTIRPNEREFRLYPMAVENARGCAWGNDALHTGSVASATLRSLAPAPCTGHLPGNRRARAVYKMGLRILVQARSVATLP